MFHVFKKAKYWTSTYRWTALRLQSGYSAVCQLSVMDSRLICSKTRRQFQVEGIWRTASATLLSISEPGGRTAWHPDRTVISAGVHRKVWSSWGASRWWLTTFWCGTTGQVNQWHLARCRRTNALTLRQYWVLWWLVVVKDRQRNVEWHRQRTARFLTNSIQENLCSPVSKLQVDSKPGKNASTLLYMHIHRDTQPANIMPLEPSIGWMEEKTKTAIQIYLYFLHINSPFRPT